MCSHEHSQAMQWLPSDSVVALLLFRCPVGFKCLDRLDPAPSASATADCGCLSSDIDGILGAIRRRVPERIRRGGSSHPVLRWNIMAKLQVVTVLALLFASASATAGLFSPTTYDECILENMKGVQSDVAARAVAKACREKFPNPGQPEANWLDSLRTRDLSDAELEALSASASFWGLTSDYSGGAVPAEYFLNPDRSPTGAGLELAIHNGTKLRVVEVTVAIWGPNKGSGEKLYSQSCDVPPDSASKLFVAITRPDPSSNWYVKSARGR